MKGFIQPKDIENLFVDIDCTIVPSFCIENAPLTITNSLGLGIPVVASHVGGIPEMIQQGVNGFTFEPGNKNDLLNKLSQIKNLTPQPTTLITIEHYVQTVLKQMS